MESSKVLFKRRKRLKLYGNCSRCRTPRLLRTRPAKNPAAPRTPATSPGHSRRCYRPSAAMGAERTSLMAIATGQSLAPETSLRPCLLHCGGGNRQHIRETPVDTPGRGQRLGGITGLPNPPPSLDRTAFRKRCSRGESARNSQEIFWRTLGVISSSSW